MKLLLLTDSPAWNTPCSCISKPPVDTCSHTCLHISNVSNHRNRVRFASVCFMLIQLGSRCSSHVRRLKKIERLYNHLSHLWCSVSPPQRPVTFSGVLSASFLGPLPLVPEILLPAARCPSLDSYLGEPGLCCLASSGGRLVLCASGQSVLTVR